MLVAVASLLATACSSSSGRDDDSGASTNGSTSGSTATSGAMGTETSAATTAASSDADTGATSGDSTGGEPEDPWACEIAPYERGPYEPAADDSVAFEAIIEAAGFASASASDWVDVAAGNLCGGSEPEIVLVKNSHSNFAVLGGPTPHAIGAGDLSSDAAHPWRGAVAGDLDADGIDEVVAVREVTESGVADFVVAAAAADCSLSEKGSLVVGGVGGSSWVGVAIGDLDGDGEREAVAATASGHLAIVRWNGAALELVDETDVAGAEAAGWRGLAVGDLDADGRDEIVVARQEDDGASSTVVVHRWDGAGFDALGGSQVGNDGNSTWAAITVGDFDGDGRAAVVLAKDSHSNFVMLDVPAGRPLGELEVRASSDLASAPGQSWRGLAVADWSGEDDGAVELVAARHASGDHRADLFVHGSAWHRALRDSALAITKAQYAAEPRDDAGNIDIPLLLEQLTATHTTTYSFLVWDETGQDYLDLVAFLEATKDFCVDGMQLRVWVTLVPPTEHVGAKCSRPAESPLTEFSEASFFADGLGESACEDYAGWGALLGELAALHPHLVALNIDDMTHNIDTVFTPELVAQMESGMRSGAPWMSMVPTFYYSEAGEPSALRWPDVGLTMDSVLFYFRNQKEGEGPCSACETPSPCPGSCLAGTCAEATVANFPEEATEMAAMLPAGRPLQVGMYFTGHSACGTPSAKYDYDLLQAAFAHPAVGGATVYTTQYPQIECDADAHLSDKGCAVQKVFAAQ